MQTKNAAFVGVFHQRNTKRLYVLLLENTNKGERVWEVGIKIREITQSASSVMQTKNAESLMNWITQNTRINSNFAWVGLKNTL